MHKITSGKDNTSKLTIYLLASNQAKIDRCNLSDIVTHCGSLHLQFNWPSERYQFQDTYTHVYLASVFTSNFVHINK